MLFFGLEYNNNSVESEYVGAHPQFVLSVSRESPVPLVPLVELDTWDLVACPESVEPLVDLEAKERR